MSNTILVTGGAGQLGSEIRVLSKELSDTFYFTDRNELDITDRDAVFNFFKDNAIDVVLNCAAYTAVDKAETEKENADAVNHIAVKILAEAAKMYNAKLLHVSTDYVFNGEGFKPYGSNDKVSPVNEYGSTKLRGEEAIKEVSPKNSVIIRTSWVYSSFGNNFVKTMLRLGAEKDSLNVISDQVGSPTYARDLAEAMLKIYPLLTNEEVMVYQYTNEGVCSWYDFADAIMEIENLDCEVHPIPTEQYPTPAKRPHYSVMNKTEIKNDFNISIPHWRNSLKSCLSILTH
ncbi:NAD(P)-dependent oxidoreductase [Neptunitalea chrysea]|uniref:dTDP-4-dehydrorhamnose reductase n=1 Tax=Neptunitalea chrysea TaxID=1647581 RepID=A0A9W6EUC6_9FLAO|nr:dTDP-4-dehydrorhamnose reductase [Neptunitalea chrysea]GLB51546.1 NAD(P)-dependent oxidoreductase [Neptunitalea chrysea]